MGILLTFSQADIIETRYQYGNDLGAYSGLGIHGQFLYVAPGADVVIARFGSHPLPLDEASETLWVDAMDAIARELA